jgi:hypothetical protein
LLFDAPSTPTSIEARLYAVTGIAGSFLRWPEELPPGATPAERAVLDAALTTSYAPPRARGHLYRGRARSAGVGRGRVLRARTLAERERGSARQAMAFPTLSDVTVGLRIPIGISLIT